MKDLKISIIGCGNLGLSIIQGLLESGIISASNLTATKRNLNPLSPLKEKGVQITSDNKQAVLTADMVILAVKPYNVQPILESLKPELKEKKPILISVATGITIQEIKDWTALDLPIFRAMPNTATDVKQSITSICLQGANKKEEDLVSQLFKSLGEVVYIPEDLMEAATVLGACGIAYVMRFIRAMIQGGIQIGFDANTASTIVNHAVKGASELLITRGEHPEFEIDKVTTPKGCTITGLNEMEHNGFSSSLIKGIVSSYQKIEK
mgnify:CR=1 FL=1